MNPEVHGVAPRIVWGHDAPCGEEFWMSEQQYWLMKTEPTVFSIKDLEKRGTEHWDGVRNYQARNFMRDQMKEGDLVLIYHSGSAPVGVAGIARVVREGYPDHTAWDPQSGHFDAKSSPEKPVWYMVDVEFVEEFPRVLSLAALKDNPALEGMLITRRGMRLSVQPVSKEHFEEVIRMGPTEISGCP
jgi:predicted RNA-binding protein with PUA-like domain